MPNPTDTDLAAAIGQRIELAADAAFRTKGEFYGAIGRDPGTMRRYLRGASMPGVALLIDVARACDVSLDWLVLGRDEEPVALRAWVQRCSEARRAAPDFERVVRFMRALPLRGWRPTEDFYEQVFLGIRGGLLEDVGGDAATVVKAARETEKFLP